MLPRFSVGIVGYRLRLAGLLYFPTIVLHHLPGASLSPLRIYGPPCMVSSFTHQPFSGSLSLIHGTFSGCARYPLCAAHRLVLLGTCFASLGINLSHLFLVPPFLYNLSATLRFRLLTFSTLQVFSSSARISIYSILSSLFSARVLAISHIDASAIYTHRCAHVFCYRVLLTYLFFSAH